MGTTCLLIPRSFSAEKFSACSQFPKYSKSGIISPGYLQAMLMSLDTCNHHHCKLLKTNM